jgi:glycosyltransferase involved in cell wall biosynthesis
MKVALFLGNAGRRSGGPEVYEVNLVRALAAIDRDNDYHLFCLEPRGPETIGVNQNNFTFHTLKPRSRPVSMSITLPLALKFLRPDVVHATFIPPVFAPMNLAYTLPCTAVFAQPQFYPAAIRIRLQYLCGIGVRKSKSVLCISEHVREYLRDRFSIPAERLPLVHLGASEAFRPVQGAECKQQLRNKFSIDFPYFLFSGRWEQRKNVLRIIEAFGLFKKNRSTPFKLVFTGQRTWAAAEAEELIARLDLQPHILDLGKTHFEDLPVLYAGAAALVYPSLWESFGLSIVEALKSGTPVITSNVAAMPEIVGPGGLLVDPRKVEHIAEAMDRIAAEKGLRERLSCAALKRGDEFSWARTARESLAVYQNMSSRN